jgi:hypothetical protein
LSELQSHASLLRGLLLFVRQSANDQIVLAYDTELARFRPDMSYIP